MTIEVLREVECQVLCCKAARRRTAPETVIRNVGRLS